jgi:DNA-binding NarL/FixJ family response regulator
MTYPILKTSVKIGIAAALAVILFQVSNIFLVYKYFELDYYITAVAILFLIAGSFIPKYNKTHKNDKQTDSNFLLTLTNRELTILQLIVDGKSNKEIAAINFVEISTIKTHINNIYAKLGLRNRRDAVNFYKTRLIEVDQD